MEMPTIVSSAEAMFTQYSFALFGKCDKKCKGGGFIKSIIEKIKDFIYFYICERYHITEYAVGAVDSLDDTVAIMDMCPWTFSQGEVFKLFLICYAKTAISIAITGALWMLYGEELATALFNIYAMPSWMLPFCLFGAAEIFTRVLSEQLFTCE